MDLKPWGNLFKIPKCEQVLLFKLRQRNKISRCFSYLFYQIRKVERSSGNSKSPSHLEIKINMSVQDSYRRRLVSFEVEKRARR